MIKIKSLLFQTLLRSSLPIVIGGSYHLFKELLFEDTANKRSHDNDYLDRLNEISFGIYTNLFAFLLVMLLFDLICEIVKNGIQSFHHEVRSSLSNNRTKEWKLLGLISDNQILRIVCYVLIFWSFQTVGFGFSELFPNNNLHHHPAFLSQGLEKSSHIQMTLKHDDVRILEEEANDAIDEPSMIMTSDKISLSMGNILSSLSLTVNAMVLSKDKKIVFATLDYHGTLQIIDISDLKSPFVLGSLNLDISTYVYRIKSLALSSDEKTLYLSNSEVLEIVNIRDLTSPKLVSRIRSEIIGLYDAYGEAPAYFKTSLGVSESTKTLYIGGLGLQVYDISNLRKPFLLKAFKNDRGLFGDELSTNELCLSRDGRTLFIANKTLDIYNISDPKEMKLLSSFKAESSPRSILLSEDFKTAFLLGTSKSNNSIIFEEMDISNYDFLKIKTTIDLGYKSNHSPRFLAISPSRSKFFIFADSDYKGPGANGLDLLIFDRIKQKAIKNEKSLVGDTFTMGFSQDGKTLITGSNGVFMIIDLFLEYPNNQIFSLSQENFINKISFPTEFVNMKISDDGKYLYVLRKEGNNQYISKDLFEIWDLKTSIMPTVLGSFNCGVHIKQMYFTRNYETVYLISNNLMFVLDIRDPSSMILKKQYKVPKQDTRLEYFVASSDEKTGFLIKSQNEAGYVCFFDLSEPSETIEDFIKMPLKSGVFHSRLILLDDDKTLMVLSREFTILNISRLTLPILIMTMPFGVNEPNPYLNSHVLSPDKKIMYLETAEQIGFNKLRIYNLSVPASPKIISEKYFSKDQEAFLKPEFSLSSDSKSGFVFQEGSLIKLDFTDLKQPRIVGVIPLSKKENGGVLGYAVAPDSATVYAAFRNEIRTLNMNPQSTLFLKQEKFLLGEKFSDSIAVLNLTSGSYNLVDTELYKVIKLSLLDIKVVPNKDSLEITNSPLPSWMTFDRETNLLTVESKKQRDIGTYTLQSTFSLKIPREIFNGIGTVENPVSSEDLVAWLISLDYVDPQLYLTP